MKLTLQNSANGLVGVMIVAFCSIGISGGPVYPLGTNVVGTYAGAMVPSCVACNGSEQVQVRCKRLDAYLNDNPGFSACEADPNNPGCSANSQGIFSITVPDTGTSAGTFVMFSQGRVFSGNIQGTADPDKQKMSGVLHATYDFSVTRRNPITGEETTTDVTAEANGGLNAKITLRASKGIRLSGFAAVDISEGFVDANNVPVVDCHIPLAVAGFKQ
jgi:hypothetical protein